MDDFDNELENNHVDYNEMPGVPAGAEDFRIPSRDNLGGGGEAASTKASQITQEPQTARKTMDKKAKGVHYEPGRIYIDNHPTDPSVNETTRRLIGEHESRKREFKDFLDTAPNLNDKYASELTQIREAFDEEDLEISPIVILNQEEFEKALRIVESAATPDQFNAFYAWDRVIVKEHTPSGSAEEVDFSREMTFGLTIHEAAHSSQGAARHIVVSKLVADPQPIRHIHAGMEVGGFRWYKAQEDGETKIVGDFWEEAFADLTRVKLLEKLGREPRADGGVLEHPDLEGDIIRLVGEGANLPSPEPDQEKISLPTKFAGAAKVFSGGGAASFVMPSNFAAYGLDLLDQQSPGLYEKMKAARRDSRRFREVRVSPRFV